VVLVCLRYGQGGVPFKHNDKFPTKPTTVQSPPYSYFQKWQIENGKMVKIVKWCRPVEAVQGSVYHPEEYSPGFAPSGMFGTP